MEKKKIMQGYQILEETETGITAMNEKHGRSRNADTHIHSRRFKNHNTRRSDKNLQKQRSAKRKRTEKVSEKQSRKTARRLFLCACR